jgi:hypothetical protein
MTRTSTEARTSAKTAARIRRKHERRIAEQATPGWVLNQTWAWVRAELKARPDGLRHAINVVTALAVELNARRAK